MNFENLNSPLKNKENFQRGFQSIVYASIHRITGKRRSQTKPKPFLARLFFANYEQQFYLSGAPINPNYTYEEQKEKFRDELTKVVERQTTLPPKVVHVDEKRIKKKEIKLDIKNKSAIYMEILYAITYSIKNEIDNEIEEEIFKMFKVSALDLVRTIFAYTNEEHDAYLKKVKILENAPLELISSNAEKDFASFVNLMKIFLKFELETSEQPEHNWEGKFCFLSNTILSINAEFLKLDKQTESLARWTAFIDIHLQFRLNLDAFYNLMQMIIEDLNKNAEGQSKRASDEFLVRKEFCKRKFLEASEKLSKSASKYIEKIHYDGCEDKVERLKKVLMIEKNIEDVRSESEKDFNERIKTSLINGTRKHFMRNLKLRKMDFMSYEEIFKEFLDILEFTIKHLKNMTEKYGNVFESHCNFSFTECLFDVYDAELTNLIKPTVIKLFLSQEKIQENVAVGLYKLYFQLSSLADEGQKKFNKDLEIGKYYEWFSMDPYKWDVISIYKKDSNYKERILNSIKFDKFKPDVETSVEGLFSSSAFDTACIFSGIKDFWKSFKCADENIKKELENTMALEICSSTKIYIDKLSEKVSNLEDSQNHVILLIPKEIFIAIENFKYLTRMNIKLLPHLVQDPKNLLHDLTNYQESAIQDLLKFGFDKAHDKIKENLKSGKNSYDKMELINRLTNYDLNTLLRFNDIETLCDRILNTLRNILEILTHHDISPNIYKSFKNLYRDVICKLNENISEDIVNVVKEVDRTLFYRGLSTNDLITQYRLDMKNQSSESGVILAILCHFEGNTLQLNILNLRNLNQIDANRKWNSYVKVDVEPKKYFTNMKKLKGKAKNVTERHALIEEKFEVKFIKEQMNIIDAALIFSVKDKNTFGRNELIAESFLPFQDIPREPEKQIYLNLVTPKKDGHEILETLKHRSSDKDAQNFLSKQITSPSIVSKNLLPKQLRNRV